MVQNSAKVTMQAGKVALGIVIGMGSVTAAAILAHASFDFVLLDDQHGDWQERDILGAFRAVSHSTAVPMVRVRYNDYASIGRVLDRGALGVVVPMVNSASEARDAAFAARYPPRGGRSYAGSLAVHYGPDVAVLADENVMLAVQIETEAGSGNAREIMAVDGVDCCWIGPMDLARSMGLDLSLTRDRARHETAIAKIREACMAAGKVPGIFTPDTETAQRRIGEGFRFITVSDDGALMAAGASRILRQLGR